MAAVPVREAGGKARAGGELRGVARVGWRFCPKGSSLCFSCCPKTC